MLTRALIVVLVLLNISVALWWALRVEPATPEPTPPSGVATLQLAPVEPGHARLPDAPAALVDATTLTEPPSAPESPSVSAPAAPPRCVALGPFADPAAAATVQARLGGVLERMRAVEEQQAAGGSNARYRVLLPPAASREAAQETVQRIVAAGLGDYYIIAQGPEANAIALGQYRNREGAERRVTALRAAGFKPLLQGGGEATSTWWVQGALVAGQAANAARQRSGAAQQRSLDCARLR
ncbi:SPOR domain-containing protein [Stenotrophomonas tumulicola]|uniref:SPOR domain-containing protein n=1 Tax=Stenotrophomonas tumulicola TaxID=1685415 RepID=A0A7W3FPR9_9GAMM|nr:SPOR domain-containing protein [Stenotrophomonas tumulicola]MBA8683469.1 SPOR domain-containing protein [Stenotrophomonas tumulicola]